MRVKKGDLAIVEGALVKFAYDYADTNTFRFLMVCTWVPIAVAKDGDPDWGWSGGYHYKINSNQNIEPINNEVADIWRKANGQLRFSL